MYSMDCINITKACTMNYHSMCSPSGATIICCVALQGYSISNMRPSGVIGTEQANFTNSISQIKEEIQPGGEEH